MPETLFDSLRASHALQRSLCTRLVRTPASRADRRRETYAALKRELAAHAAAEERYLYVPILLSDAGLQVARHALSEHHEIDELVEDLGELDPAGDAWHAKALELSHEVRHHLKEEESRFFQVSGKLLSERAKSTLARQYRKDYVRMLDVRPAS